MLSYLVQFPLVALFFNSIDLLTNVGVVVVLAFRDLRVGGLWREREILFIEEFLLSLSKKMMSFTLEEK